MAAQHVTGKQSQLELLPGILKVLIPELFFFIQYLVASSFLYVLQDVVFTLIFFFISEFK